MKQPRDLVERREHSAEPPAGTDERFSGYGVMGLPFSSGHVLAMRRFVVTSVGEGYTSVWHRDPNGTWIFYSDVDATHACPRYFGADITDTVRTAINLAWPAPERLRVTIPAVDFEWEVGLAPTAATRFMNAMGAILPEAAWRAPLVLSSMESVAGPLLGVGRIGLQGTTPNGQRFIANPRVIWAITETRARFGDADLGAPGPVQPQARLGDFWIPQRGMFALGQASFETFDPVRHSSQTSAQSRVTP
jgi:hypothetical protein